MTSEEGNKLTGVTAEIIDNFNYKVTVTTIVSKQKYHKWWLMWTGKGNIIQNGTSLSDVIEKLGYEGNIRYKKKVRRRRKK